MTKKGGLGCKYGKNKDNLAISSAYMESIACNGALAKILIKTKDKKACIHVHSCRHRLADPDGISIKYALDGIVETGILRGDDDKFIKEISFSQEKSKEEKTIITITWS